MKLRSSCQLIGCTIEEYKLQFDAPSTIELELSAIDTGGGYKDPIIDFSCTVKCSRASEPAGSQNSSLTLELRNPQEGTEITFSGEGVVNLAGQNMLEINGRLHENEITDTLIGFVLKSVR